MRISTFFHVLYRGADAFLRRGRSTWKATMLKNYTFRRIHIACMSLIFPRSGILQFHTWNCHFSSLIKQRPLAIPTTLLPSTFFIPSTQTALKKYFYFIYDNYNQLVYLSTRLLVNSIYYNSQPTIMEGNDIKNTSLPQISS